MWGTSCKVFAPRFIDVNVQEILYHNSYQPVQLFDVTVELCI